jgi:5-methylcytosine-specific restriction endonuclease McrA
VGSRTQRNKQFGKCRGYRRVYLRGLVCEYCKRVVVKYGRPTHVIKNLDNACSVDHVIPLARGGTNTLDNLVIACVRCNNEKNDMLLSEWIDRWYEQA